MMVFLVAWSLLVYAPMAHMVWGKGGLLNAALGGRFPCLDFAGGTVVHITSGVSALVCALYLGKRVGYPKEPMPPHSVVLSFIGACMLWVGWFGFNAGSALSAGSLATSRLRRDSLRRRRRRHRVERAEWIVNGKPSALGAISGAVAGLVAITPAAGFVGSDVGDSHRLDRRSVLLLHGRQGEGELGYDDSLDAFGVHGAGGTLGAILTGVFASKAINPIFKDAQGNALNVGLVDGNAHQLLNQSVWLIVAWALAAVGTIIILKAVDLTIGLRVTEDDEVQGLDLTQHGEEGYSWSTA